MKAARILLSVTAIIFGGIGVAAFTYLLFAGDLSLLNMGGLLISASACGYGVGTLIGGG